jgi:hypothetical protein
MTRKNAIVGAGQSGLQTGIGLLKAGYDVSILSNRTGEQIKAGKVMSSQCMFDMALQNERDLGVNYWDKDCPPVEGIGLRVPDPAKPGSNLIEWAARLDKPAQSVDQRIKMPVWMDEFVRLGGDLQIRDVDIDVLVVEVAEHLYAIDRLFFHVTQHLHGCAGIRLGRISEVPENDRPFGFDEVEIVQYWCGRSGIPYLGRADIGHDADNRIVPFGLARVPARS